MNRSRSWAQATLLAFAPKRGMLLRWLPANAERRYEAAEVVNPCGAACAPTLAHPRIVPLENDHGEDIFEAATAAQGTRTWAYEGAHGSAHLRHRRQLTSSPSRNPTGSSTDHGRKRSHVGFPRAPSRLEAGFEALRQPRRSLTEPQQILASKPFCRAGPHFLPTGKRRPSIGVGRWQDLAAGQRTP